MRSYVKQWMAAAAVVGGLFGGASSYAAIGYDTAVVHYTFDAFANGTNTLADSGTAHITLTAAQDSTATGSFAIVPGIHGNALFLGDADGLPNSDGGAIARTSTVNTDNALNTTRDTDFSFDTFAQLSAVGNGFFLASKQLSSGNFTGWVVQIQRNGTIQVIFRSTNTPDGRIIVTSTDAIIDTNWHNIGMSFDYDATDATRGVRLYLDGNPIAATASSTGLAGDSDVDLSTTNNRFTLSGRNSGQVDDGGTLDDLAVWKQILTPSDFATIGAIPEPGAVGPMVVVSMALLRRRRR